LLDIVGDNVTDEMTILNFRHGREKHLLTEAIFAEIGAHLAQKWLTMKTDTICGRDADRHAQQHQERGAET
jgi:hypothetical protein